MAMLVHQRVISKPDMFKKNSWNLAVETHPNQLSLKTFNSIISQSRSFFIFGHFRGWCPMWATLDGAIHPLNWWFFGGGSGIGLTTLVMLYYTIYHNIILYHIISYCNILYVYIYNLHIVHSGYVSPHARCHPRRFTDSQPAHCRNSLRSVVNLGAKTTGCYRFLGPETIGKLEKRQVKYG